MAAAQVNTSAAVLVTSMMFVVLSCSSLGAEFGVYLGEGPSSICYGSSTPPRLHSFSVCSFLKVVSPAANSEVLRYEAPGGTIFTLGSSYFGVWIRVLSKRLSSTGKQILSDELHSFEVSLPPSKWRGVCVTFDASTGQARCFIDGKEEKVSSMKIKKTVHISDEEQKEHDVSQDETFKQAMMKLSSQDETFIIVNETFQFSNTSVDNTSLYRAKRQSKGPICAGSTEFVGELAGMQLWNVALIDTDVMRKSNCKSAKLASAGNILNMNGEWRFYGNSSKKIYKRTSLCSDLATFLLIRPGGSFTEANEHCLGIGGHLSEPAVIDDELLSLARNTYDSCVALDGTVSWLTHTLTNPAIETKFCEALDKDGKTTFKTCVRRLMCSLCIAITERFTLYGHNGEYFDYVFYLYANVNGDPRWEGVRKSLIARVNDTWILSSREHTVKLYAPDMAVPIGRAVWTWSDKLPGQSDDITLTFTVCRTSEFSCEDGQCIPFQQRCDDVLNCRDSSDEKSCSVIKAPKNYDPVYIPPLRAGEVLPAPIGYHVDVYNLGRITTDEGRAKIDLGLTMTWFDPRIDFSNLKPVQKNYFQCPMVWLPRVRAITGYGDGSVLDVKNYENFCYVYSDEQDEIRALQDPLMGYLSPGKKYSINYYVGMLVELPCEFDFVRYPFDKQQCNVSIMVMNAQNERYFNKSSEGDVVPYLNKKLILLEYRLLNITTAVSYNMRGSDNNTFFVITLHFRRLYGYHIMNSFFPSLLMALVSYSTFFFQIDDFTNRIMVSLTAQLVLAALFTSTTASSVKTPYLKMIDVWYACIIAFCFLIVLAQVIVDAVRNKVEDDHKKEQAERLQLKQELAESMPQPLKKTLSQHLSVTPKLDFVHRVNKVLKGILMGLLIFFVFVYSVIAAGYY
ncbi:Low-density lipoprotein (LDL) receptor class A repeat [Trinorchestia longiramus]|nr:Low-density lipoprotein (LDL) receptor class A repeat [Trinorchestia longiramus]